MNATSVYQYFNSRGRLLYVGVTDRGMRRLHEHAESKEWWKYTTGCTIEHYPTRDEALERERFLISTYCPPFNKQHNPMRNAPLKVDDLHVPAKRRAKSARGIAQTRRDWYSLSKDQKKVAPCVSCGERPGIVFPECNVCKPVSPRSVYGDANN